MLQKKSISNFVKPIIIGVGGYSESSLPPARIRHIVAAASGNPAMTSCVLPRLSAGIVQLAFENTWGIPLALKRLPVHHVVKKRGMHKIHLEKRIAMEVRTL